MKKIDCFCFIMSIIINILVIFILTFNPPLVADNSIKIGIISLENNQETSGLKNEKNIDSKTQNLEAKEIKKEVEKDNNLDKNKLEKNVEENNSKVSNSEVVNKEESKKPSLDDLKKAIAKSKPNLKNNLDKSESFSPTSEDSEELDRILGTVKGDEGLTSGDKLGVIDGKTVVKWNPNNKKPVFPESAELSGKNGRVLILLKVDRSGNIITYRIEKGSGVAEIDAAIEKVIGSWKINLLKKDKNIAGTFYINYNFNLK